MTPRRPRLAITLGDPRGIGPEIVAKALAQPLTADFTFIGAEDQIADLPGARVAVGAWRLGAGARPEDRPRVARAGQLAGHAVERAVAMARSGEVDGIVTEIGRAS